MQCANLQGGRRTSLCVCVGQQGRARVAGLSLPLCPFAPAFSPPSMHIQPSTNTGACPVTTDLTMRVNVTKPTTTAITTTTNYNTYVGCASYVGTLHTKPLLPSRCGNGMWIGRVAPSPALLVFRVEVHESFRGSFHRFHGIFHESFRGSFRESFHGRYGSFHGKKMPQASTEAFAKASMEVASTEASIHF